jgi:NAD(P)-dependent dehydrogenase (short-subunit alcohol dehydrogenase family)
MADGPRNLSGRHAVVTGASRGIGLAIARELAGRGAGVTLMARGMPALLDAVRGLGPATVGQTLQAVGVDVTRAESVADAFRDACAAGGPVDILVNNAGGAHAMGFTGIDPPAWEVAIALNLTSVFLCTREVLQGMVDRRRGRVVNVASTAGLRGFKYVSAYTAAKHGVVGLTRAVAMEVQESGVTVNAVCPGFVDTEMTRTAAKEVADRVGRDVESVLADYAALNAGGALVEPGAVAEKVAWLCEPGQDWITGEVVVIE